MPQPSYLLLESPILARYKDKTQRRQCKMSSSEKIDLYAAGVYLSEAQNSIPPPPLHTVYVHTVYFFTQETREGGGGELNQ